MGLVHEGVPIMIDTTKDLLLKYVTNIVDDIENPAESTWWQEYKEAHEFDDDEEPTAYYYLEDALGMEFTISGNGDYLGAEICVGWGGPGLYINTRERMVEGYWGGDEVKRGYQDNLDLDDYCEEMYDNIR